MKSLLSKFPISPGDTLEELTTDWKQNLFVPFTDAANKIFIPLPRNLEAFGDKALMICIVKICDIMDYVVVDGPELKPTVFNFQKKSLQNFFFGFTSGASYDVTGALSKLSGQFGKGVRLSQTYSVLNAMGSKSTSHLKLSKKTLSTYLDQLPNLSKEFWGLKAKLLNLFTKAAQDTTWNERSTYLRKSEDLKRRIIKSNFPWNNKGVFSDTEMNYIKFRLRKQLTIYNNFVISLDNPSDSLAENFDENYKRALSVISPFLKEYTEIQNFRSIHFFPRGENRNVKKFRQLSRKEKIASIRKDKLSIILNPSKIAPVMDCPDNRIFKYTILTDFIASCLPPNADVEENQHYAKLLSEYWYDVESGLTPSTT